MAKISVTNFIFIEDPLIKGPAKFSLPDVQHQPGGKKSILARRSFFFELDDLDPAQKNGMFSFCIHARRGDDDGINVEFQITVNGTKYVYGFDRHITACFQVQVGLRDGQNTVEVVMTRGGTITSFDPDRNLGGKGLLNFSQMCLTYHRSVTV